MITKCQKCNSDCDISGEFPEFFTYCETCEDYATGFDDLEYTADYMADLIDRRDYG